MSGFWRWLARANARTVLLCGMAGLCIVGAWWVYKELLPDPSETQALGGSYAPVTRAAPHIVDYLDAQRALSPAEAPLSPFLRPLPNADPEKRPERPAQRAGGGPRADGQKPAADRQKPAAPKEKIVKLTYRGMFTRPDGRTLALIQDDAAGRSSFHEQGGALHGFTVTAIAFDSVSLARTNDAPVALLLGQPKKFMEDGDERR